MPDRWNSRRYMMRDFDHIYKHLEGVLYLLKKDSEIARSTHPEITKALEKYAQVIIIAEETLAQLKQQIFK